MAKMGKSEREFMDHFDTRYDAIRAKYRAMIGENRDAERLQEGLSLIVSWLHLAHEKGDIATLAQLPHPLEVLEYDARHLDALRTYLDKLYFPEEIVPD